MTTQISPQQRQQYRDSLDLWRNGMRITMPELYVLPTQACVAHENFVQRIHDKKWGFVLVAGENRAGKSAYIKFLEDLANQKGYAVAHIELNPQEIRQYTPTGYFNLQVFRNLRLGSGRVLSYELENNEPFRRRLHDIIESRFRDLEFWSSALAAVLLVATSDADENIQNLARSWLRGEQKSIKELQQMQVFDRGRKSILSIPTDKVLYFMRELCWDLDHSGFVVTIDEIEKIADRGLPPARGRECLSIMRDLVNFLVSDDAMPNKRGIINGIFIVFAISTFFLGYSGLIEAENLDFRAQADRYGRPKITIGEVPRLHTMLKHNASRVVTDIQSMEELARIAERVKFCYCLARGKDLDITPDEIAAKAYDRTGVLKAGENIQEMITILDGLSGS